MTSAHENTLAPSRSLQIVYDLPGDADGVVEVEGVEVLGTEDGSQSRIALAAELIDAVGAEVDGRVVGDGELAAEQVKQFGVVVG